MKHYSCQCSEAVESLTRFDSPGMDSLDVFSEIVLVGEVRVVALHCARELLPSCLGNERIAESSTHGGTPDGQPEGARPDVGGGNVLPNFCAACSWKSSGELGTCASADALLTIS